MLSKNQSIGADPSSNQHNTVLPLSETDPEAARQQSAANKLELFETVREMQSGCLPRNDQLDSLLERLINNRVIRSREHRMSQDGKNLLNDFRDLLETLRRTLQTKNKDELFQSYVYHLHCMDIPISKEHISNSVNESDKNAVKQEGKKGSRALYNIGRLILLNNEFRSLLGELIDISQNIFTSVTNQVGEDLKQTGDNLKGNMDKKESGKEMVDKMVLDDYQRHEEPHLIDENATDPTHAGLLNTGDSIHPDMLPTHQKHAHQTSQLDTSRVPIDNLNQYQSAQLQSNQTPYNNTNQTEYYKNAMQQKAGEHTETAKHHLEKHKQNFNQTVQKNVDDDKQTELLDRLRYAIGQVQKHPRYQEAIVTLIGLIKSWTHRLRRATGNIKDHVQSQDTNQQAANRDQAEAELKAIIEGWAQGESIDPILESVQAMMDDAKNDETLRLYYDTTLKYIQRLLRDPGYINSDDSTEHGQELIDNGRELMKGKYGEHVRNFSDQARSYMHLMAEDEISREINDRLTQIHQDLWMDSDGYPAFKPHLVNDMRKTLLPAFLDEIKFIPIPRIEFSDKQFDIVAENVIISGETLLPNFFDVKAESFSSFNFKSDEDTSSSHQSLLIHMSEIQADINDVLFSYKKKTGFPKVSDSGVASLTIDKRGISIVVRVQSTNNPAKTFKVTYCKCHVDHIKVKVNDSKHDVLYKVVLPLVMGTLRKQIARNIEMKIIEILNNLDQKVTVSLVNMNQNLQNKAYEALPESEKADPYNQPQQLSQARPRPGLFSTLVSIVNRNIQSKAEKRNIEKKSKKSNESPTASMKTDRFHSLAYAPSNNENSVYNHQPPLSKLKDRHEAGSTLASSSLNNEYTNLPQDIASNAATLGSSQSGSGNSSHYQQSNVSNGFTPQNQSVSSTRAFMTEPKDKELKNVLNIDTNSSSKQLNDTMVTSQGINGNPTGVTYNNNLRHEPRYKNLNHQYTQNSPLSFNQSNQDDKITPSSVPSSGYYPSPSNGRFSESSMTGTHNTPLSHGHTIDQNTRLSQQDVGNNNGSSFTGYSGMQPHSDATNQLGFNHSPPNSSSSVDSIDEPISPSTMGNRHSIGSAATSLQSSNTVNSNGIDNQHFKLAMELGEAQNPHAPLPVPSHQNRGNLEGSHQL